MKTFSPELLIEEANRSRHIDTTAEHIAAMIDADDVDLVVAIWTDVTEPAGIANLVFKGADLLPRAGGKRRKLNLVVFWLRSEAHADAIGQELEELVQKATTIRGEFHPIADDVAFEFVPTAEDAENLYVVKGGARIARRGRPGTREARRWISLVLGYQVRDLSPEKIEVHFGDAHLRFGCPH